MQQRCKVCGRADKFDFDIPDDIWRAVVPTVFHNSVVCLACFDFFASAKNIGYDIPIIYFAGDKECFTFVKKPQ